MSQSTNYIDKIIASNSLNISMPGVISIEGQAFAMGDLAAGLFGNTGPNPGKNVVTNDINGQSLPISYFGFQEVNQLLSMRVKVAAYNVTLDESYSFSFDVDCNIGANLLNPPTYLSPIFNLFTQMQNASAANVSLGMFPGGFFIQGNGVAGQEIRWKSCGFASSTITTNPFL